MPDNIAFELIGHALKVKKAAKNKYYSGGAYDKITEKVMQMPGDKAKRIFD